MYLITNKKGDVVDVVDYKDDRDDVKGTRIFAHDIVSFEEATRLAESATKAMGVPFLPCDHGEWRHPRYAVISAPRMGDPVSYAFNGDYYPAGHITKMSDSFYRLQTSTGDVFYRSKHTAGWKKKGGTWWMVAGHHNERNPHF